MSATSVNDISEFCESSSPPPRKARDATPNTPNTTPRRLTNVFLITGSSGFIGQRLAESLLKFSCTVVGLDIKPMPERLRKYVAYDHIQKDITSEDLCDELMYNFDDFPFNAVIHLAGLISVSDSQREQTQYLKTNVEGTQNILDFVVAHRKYHQVNTKFIFASSAAVYDTTDLVKCQALKETDTLKQVSVYGQTKREGECLIDEYVDNYAIEAVSFRFFNVAGGLEVHDPPLHLIPIALAKCRRGESITIFGKSHKTLDGSCVRDFFHVKDLIRAIEIAIVKWDIIAEYALNENTEIEGFHRIYNLGSGRGGNTVLQVCRAIVLKLHNYPDLTDSEEFGSLKFAAPRACDPAVLLADCTRIKTELNWEANFTIEDIIKDCIIETFGPP
jgi:UDP-glucose 4-epimerase